MCELVQVVTSLQRASAPCPYEHCCPSTAQAAPASSGFAGHRRVEVSAPLRQDERFRIRGTASTTTLLAPRASAYLAKSPI